VIKIFETATAEGSAKTTCNDLVKIAKDKVDPQQAGKYLTLHAS
jgi:hypothetical protein